MHDLDAGDVRPDLLEAAARLGDVGEPLLDLDSGHRGQDHEARTRLMTQRLQDAERAEASEYNGDDLMDPVPPPSADGYDLDDRSERQRYAVERLEGRDVGPDSAYSSSDYPEEE